MIFFVNNITTDWSKFISNEFTKSYLQNIDAILSNQQENIIPNKNDIFRAFNFFNICDTKLVIFGQDPYATDGVADGLAFSTRNNTIPPSLKNIFKKLNIDLNIYRTNPDLSDWAKQGVLLLNSSLTVNLEEPNSHKNIGWNNFIINLIEFMNKNTENITFLLLGKNAQNISKYIDQHKHSILMRPHPSPLARNKIFEKDLFVELNNLIFANKFYYIKW